MNHHGQLEQLLKDLERERRAKLLPLMTQSQPDTAERKRLEMQRLPWALPERKED